MNWEIKIISKIEWPKKTFYEGYDKGLYGIANYYSGFTTSFFGLFDVVIFW